MIETKREMMRTFAGFSILSAWLILSGTPGCRDDVGSIESLSLDFPHGETRLFVRRNGEAFLFYGALPQFRKIKTGAFDIEEVYGLLRERLHENTPRETWPNPKSRAGMVVLRFRDQSERVYLIFDEDALADRLFRKAKDNIVLKRGDHQMP